jgi:hypothetical protein
METVAAQSEAVTKAAAESAATASNNNFKRETLLHGREKDQIKSHEYKSEGDAETYLEANMAKRRALQHDPEVIIVSLTPNQKHGVQTRPACTSPVKNHIVRKPGGARAARANCHVALKEQRTTTKERFFALRTDETRVGFNVRGWPTPPSRGRLRTQAFVTHSQPPRSRRPRDPKRRGVRQPRRFTSTGNGGAEESDVTVRRRCSVQTHRERAEHLAVTLSC